MHVNVVCGAVFLLLRGVRSGPRLSASLAGLVLAGYVVTVGYTPSVLRAALMAAVGLLALFLGRQRAAMPALAFAVCVLVLYDPEMAVRFGFAMSVAATAALVVLAPRWVGSLRSRGVPVGFASAGVVPLVAFLATAPLIAGMAGEVSLVAVGANILATPVVAVTTVLGALATATAGAAPWLGELLARSAWPGLSWLLLVARGAADVPAGVLGWPDGWLGGGLAALLSLSCVLACRYRTPRRVLAACLVLALVVWAAARLSAPGWPPASWAVIACDVGQGDGLLLATGEAGSAVVVDTGSARSGMVACLDRVGVDRVPLLVVTHLHEDHYGDLPAVLDGTQVDAVAVGPGRTPERAWTAVVNAARDENVPLVELAPGDAMSWPRLDLRVLGPRHVPAEQAAEPGGTAVNDLSLAVTADTPAGRILLPGDGEVAAQGDLLAAGHDLRADVLKVPHHGSGNTRDDFLRAVAPDVAVISVGEGNQHDHPDTAVVDQLTGAGTRIARTDRAGDIAVVPARDGIVIARRY
ncbi:ComEC/Rec2 family competence protein [Haloechinothrix aidingensis]|uniref:ComEC/Rec2 family competence protein n=1 Tax=Haloechinothrix aidingensis TaxID=2752311 RepID=UPI0024833A73|nr:ComEC/Rec2 family competence protein [Haloechinothrix aidingensis]